MGYDREAAIERATYSKLRSIERSLEAINRDVEWLNTHAEDQSVSVQVIDGGLRLVVSGEGSVAIPSPPVPADMGRLRP